MARLHLTFDTANSNLGFLVPADLESISAFIDLFYLACLREELADEDGDYRLTGSITSNRPTRSRKLPLSRYDAEVEVVQFSNPLKLVAFFKNVSAQTAQWVLDRTLFHREESIRRVIQNEISRQKLIELKLKNAAVAASTRKKLIQGGLSEEEAMKLLGNLLADQQATVMISGPEDGR